MSAFSSNESCSLERKADISVETIITDNSSLQYVYELDKCAVWIQDNGAKKVCLQFPDALLCDSVNVALALEQLVDCRTSILGDTSYGSCCVDEVAAQHFAADAIVHFGSACLSPTTRLPVLYIFQKQDIDIENFTKCFHNTFTSDSHVLLLYDVSYFHAIDEIQAELSAGFQHLLIPQLATLTHEAELTNTRRLGRYIALADTIHESEYNVLFIGQDGRTLSNFMLDIHGREYYLYHPGSPDCSIRAHPHEDSTFLRRRLYLVEQVKDAQTLGIVVGTLGVADYLAAVDRVKQLAKRAGKKCYIIAVGKPNVPKLANFPEVDVFVLIACPENSLLDSKEFYRPIVTPYDVELAINPELDIGQTYVTDFREMLPGGRHHTNVNEIADRPTDMSLISGQLRYPTSDQAPVQSEEGCVAVRADTTLAIPDSTGIQFFGSRSWRGLQPSLGETEVTLAQPGRSGIAQNYQEMQHEQALSTTQSGKN